MNWTPTVKSIVDGTDVSAATLNAVLAGHTNRSEHLYEQLLALKDKGTLISLAEPIAPGLDTIVDNSVVYQAPTGLRLAKAELARTTVGSLFSLASSAYVLGIVKSVDGVKADVYTHGTIKKTKVVEKMLEPGHATYSYGPLFLSATAAGKLTSSPGGVVVLVGFARTADEIYLYPQAGELGELFYNFRSKVLDRPVGLPVFASSVWTLGSSAPSRVGWSKVETGDTTQPTGVLLGSLFRYNLPPDSDIDKDNGLTPTEKAEAKALRRALPPHPQSFNFLAVNGVMQLLKEEADDGGTYLITEHGLWWYTNVADKAPWSEAINLGISLKATNTNVTPAHNKVHLLANNAAGVNVAVDHPFTADHEVTLQLKKNGTALLPGGLAADTDYRLILDPADPRNFTLSLSGVAVPISDTANIGIVQFHPSLWPLWRKQTQQQLRPKILLSSVKLNPALAASIVTSLEPYVGEDNNSSTVLQVVNGDNVAAKTGELKLKFNLALSPSAEPIPTATAVKSLTYNQVTGQLKLLSGAVVSSLQGLGGIKVTKDAATGAHEISVLDFLLSGEVSSIEVEQARLEFLGLHSYVRIDQTSLPAGFVGKFLLPDVLPVGKDIQIKLKVVGKETTPDAARKLLKIKFEYAVTKPGVALTSATTTTTGIASLAAMVPASEDFVLDKVYTVADATFLRIPASALVASGLLNFRFHLLASVATAETTVYNKSVGVLAAQWAFVL